jgi:hypothetical protein
MKTRQEATVPPEKLLCILAREFRGTSDEQQRMAIAGEYAKAVNRIIRDKKGEEIPLLKISFRMSGCPTHSSHTGRFVLPPRERQSPIRLKNEPTPFVPDTFSCLAVLACTSTTGSDDTRTELTSCRSTALAPALPA